MTNEELTRIILGKMQEVLKPRGFRKKGSTFVADPENVRLAVQFEKCWVSTSSEVVGYVNLAALSRVLIQKGVGFTNNENSLCLSDWHLQTRLGFLMPERRDRWWQVHNEQEALRAGEEIATALVSYGLPALERLSSTARLHEFLRQGPENELQTWLVFDCHREKYLSVLENLRQVTA